MTASESAPAPAKKRSIPVKPFVFAACLVPAAVLIWRAATDNLGPNPIETLHNELGEWAIRFLLAALAVTPARKLFGWNVLARYRRMIGLFAFFYVAMHLINYVALDHQFNGAAIWADVVKRTFITAGMAAFVILVPLAATSTAAAVKKLGGKRWQKLHRGVYAAGVLAVIHYILQSKGFQPEPYIHAAILAFLLGVRIWFRFRA
ncbi:MAG: protein-methionine-sulfoxide reductase heme-binding subunit MsrQ [Rhodospirillales bacterium]